MIDTFGPRVIFFFILIMFCWGSSPAQIPDSSQKKLTMEKYFLGYKFYHGKEPIHLKKLEKLLELEPGARVELGNARQSQFTSRIIGSVAGFLIGWPLGEAIAGKEEPRWNLAAIGGFLLIPTIFMEKKADRHYHRAVDYYNARVDHIPLPGEPEPGLAVKLETSYVECRLQSGNIIQGRLIGKKRGDLYVQKKDVIYIAPLDKIVTILLEGKDITEQALQIVQEKEIDLFPFILKEVE